MGDAASAAPAGAASNAAPAGQNSNVSGNGKNPQQAGGGGNAAPAAAKKPAASPPADKIRAAGGAEIPDDIEELKRGYGHMQAANERMRIAAEKEKAAEAKERAATERLQGVDALEKAFKAAEQGDFTELVRKVGYTKAKEFAEMLLLAEIEWNEMTPEQQEAARLKKENASYKKRDDDAKARADAEKKTAETNRAFDDIDREVTSALKKIGKTPTPRVVARIVEKMLDEFEGDETKARPVSADEAYQRVVSDMHGDIDEYLGGLTAAELRQVLSQKVRDTLREADVEDVMSQDPLRSGRRPASTNQPSDDARRKKIPHEDYWAKKEKKFGGRR